MRLNTKGSLSLPIRKNPGYNPSFARIQVVGQLAKERRMASHGVRSRGAVYTPRDHLIGGIMLPVIFATMVITGGVTFYYGEPFEGTPLACGYVYDCKETEPWGAFPIEWYEDGTFRCGDLVQVTFGSGRKIYVRAYDKCPGCLSYSVWDTGYPFVVDLPRCLRDGEPTATGTIFNVSRWRRENDTDRRFYRSARPN